MSDDGVFERLAKIESDTANTYARILELRTDVRSLEEKILGSAVRNGVCTRLSVLESWQKRMARSISYLWAGITTIVAAIVIRFLSFWISEDR